MRTVARTVVAAAFLCSALPILAAAQVLQSKESLQDMYTSYLKGEGYAPEIDADGDVKFKIEGRTYYIIVNQDDPTYFQVVYAGFWPLETAAEQQKAVAAANTATRLTKVAKVVVTSRLDDVQAGYEIHLASPTDFTRFFRRAISHIATARNRFIEEMNKPAAPTRGGEPPDVSAMKSDLRTMVSAQESYFADSSKYATKLSDIDVRLSGGVVLKSLTVIGLSWKAIVTHARLPGVECGIAVGGDKKNPVSPSAGEGEAACR